MGKRVISILLGCFITSIGTIFLQHAHLVIGGTCGLSLSLSYLLSWPFSLLFFLVNIPFYLFALLRMGANFTLATFLSVSALSLITAALEKFLSGFTPDLWVGAVAGGALSGIGLSILFANRASLGGANILALYLEEKRGINPGLSNCVFDAVVVVGGIYAAGYWQAVYSILAVFIIAAVISFTKKRRLGSGVYVAARAVDAGKS